MWRFASFDRENCMEVNSEGMRPGNFTVTPRWLEDHVFFYFIEVQVGFEHQGKWWQIDCHHNVSQGGGGISWAVCTKFSSWRDAPLLPPHPTIGSPVLPWFSIHVEEFIPSSLQYLSHVSLHHFPIYIQHVFLRDKLYHTSSYTHITYCINLIISYIKIPSSYYSLPSFPQIFPPFLLGPSTPTIPRASPGIPRGLGGEALPAAPRGPGPALCGVRDAAADGGAVSTGWDHPGLQRLGNRGKGWMNEMDNVYLCIMIDLW